MWRVNLAILYANMLQTHDLLSGISRIYKYVFHALLADKNSCMASINGCNVVGAARGIPYSSSTHFNAAHNNTFGVDSFAVSRQ